MPALLEGVELLLLCIFALLVALLYATKWTIEPVVRALHGLLGWVPGASRMVQKVDDAIIGAIDGAIRHTESGIVNLCHGLVWSLDLTLDGLRELGAAMVAALRYAHNTAVPNIVHAVVGDIAADVKRLEHQTLEQLRDTFDFVAALEAKIANMGTATYDRVVRNLHALTHDDIAAAEHRAAQVGRDAVAALRTAEDAAITNARAVGQSALNQIAHAEAVAADEVLHLPGIAADDLQRLLRGVDWHKLAGILGSVPLLYALIQALTREAGLSDPECRNKVKQICGTDTSRWLHLLEGLAALGFAFNFEEIVTQAGKVAHEAKPLLDKLAA